MPPAETPDGGNPRVGIPSALVERDDGHPEWVRALGAGGPDQDEALGALHAMLVRIARSELRRRGSQLRLAGPELDDLADQSADDALLAITAKLGEFRGESRFTTWAYMFVILEVSNKIGRHFWRRPTVTMETDDWDRLPDRLGMGPPEAAQHQDLLVALRRAVDEELSEHQRQVFTAIVVDGIPVDALAVRLSSNRNALYKTMFDARRKIRAALVANGYLDIMRTPSPDAPASIQAARRR